MRDVLPAGGPATNFVAAGTALRRDAILCNLQSTSGWQMQVFRAITKWPARMDLWTAWEQILHNYEDGDREAKALAFYDTNREAMHTSLPWDSGTCPVAC